VSPDAVSLRVVRLGRQRFELALATSLPPLANLRLRVRFPGAEHESEDIYAKVLASAPMDGGQRARVHLTSVDPADRAAIERILGV
jgi:hypothetical protein